MVAEGKIAGTVDPEAPPEITAFDQPMHEETFVDDPRVQAEVSEDNKAQRLTQMAAANSAGVGCCQFLIWIGVGTFWVVVYGNYSGDSCRYPLPTWCLVNGISAFCSIPLSIFSALAARRQLKKAGEHKDSKLYQFMGCFSCLIMVFHLVWFILGNVWSWGQDKTECTESLLDICRTYLIIVYCFIGLIYYCACCCAPIALLNLTKGK